MCRQVLIDFGDDIFGVEYGSVAKIIGLIIFLLNAISVSQAFFFFLRLICVSDRECI